jgi:hypothetical protein
MINYTDYRSLFKGYCFGTVVFIRKFDLKESANQEKDRNLLMDEINSKQRIRHQNFINIMAISLGKSSILTFHSYFEAKNLEEIMLNDDINSLVKEDF